MDKITTASLYEQYLKQNALFNKVLDFLNRVKELWENAPLKERPKLEKLRDEVEKEAQICYRVMRALNRKYQEEEGILDNYSYYWEDYDWENEIKELKICLIKQ